MARLQHSVDDKLKAQAETILRAQGLTPSVATRMFYIEIVNQKGLPFMPSKVNIPNSETLQAFSHTDEGIDLEGPFDSPDELFKSLKK